MHMRKDGDWKPEHGGEEKSWFSSGASFVCICLLSRYEDGRCQRVKLALLPWAWSFVLILMGIARPETAMCCMWPFQQLPALFGMLSCPWYWPRIWVVLAEIWILPSSVVLVVFFHEGVNVVLKILVKSCALVPVQSVSCWCSRSRSKDHLGSPKYSFHYFKQINSWSLCPDWQLKTHFSPVCSTHHLWLA